MAPKTASVKRNEVTGNVFVGCASGEGNDGVASTMTAASWEQHICVLLRQTVCTRYAWPLSTQCNTAITEVLGQICTAHVH